eukprot:Gb_37988 [translate_table: standard]
MSRRWWNAIGMPCPDDGGFPIFHLIKFCSVIKGNSNRRKVDHDVLSVGSAVTPRSCAWAFKFSKAISMLSSHRARGHDGSDKVESYVLMPISVKRRLNPPIPKEFFGCVLALAYAVAVSGDVVDFAVERLHQSIARVDESYVKSQEESTKMFGILSSKPEMVNIASW